MNIRLGLTGLLLTAAFMLYSQVLVMDSTDNIKFDSTLQGRAAWEKIYVLNVIYPQLPYSVRSGEILSSLSKNPKLQKVRFFALVPAPLAAVQKFAQEHPEFDFTICADMDLKGLRHFLGKNASAVNPANIFNAAGKLLWSGDAIDLPMMLKLITQNKYSERNEIRMSALSSNLQAALRSGNPRLIRESAEKILQLRPEQLSAVNAKAYALESSGNTAELEKFLRERLQRFPQAEENYFMLIEVAFRRPQLAHAAPEIARIYIEKFPGKTANIASIAWSLLNNQPYSAEAFAAAALAVKKLESLPEAEQNSRIIATRAIFAYRRCDLAQAKKLTQAALKKAPGQADRNMLENLLKYFRKVSE